MSFVEEHCILVPLTRDILETVGDFRCSVEPEIEAFFKEESVDYAAELMGVSYGFIDKANNHLVSAFCLTCASVEMDEMPKSVRNKLNRKVPHVKQRETYPAVLLAQLAVFDEYKAFHIGDELMDQIKLLVRHLTKRISARYMIVDAINKPAVLAYYARNNFKMIFAEEEEEKRSEGRDKDFTLRTRFMITDLKDVN